MKVALLFPGQGAQHVGMGADLCASFPAADDIFRRASEAAGFDLKALCFSGPEEELMRTDISQPAIVTTSIAFLEMVRRLGKLTGHEVVGVAGLSLGEYSAHVAAGTLDLADAIRLVCRRGQLMQEAAQRNPGAMVSVIGLDPAKLERAVADASALGMVSIANYNSPDQQVISGMEAAVDKAAELAQAAGASHCVKLRVAGAFHSPLMQSAGNALSEVLAKVDFGPAAVPVVSNVTGSVLTDGAAEARALLAQQVVASVRWETCVHKLVEMGAQQFIEVGPGRVLRGLCRKIDRNVPCVSVNTVEALQALA